MHTLRSGALNAKVATVGAELRSLQTDGSTELIWHGDPNWWGYSAPLLFPIVGRLEEDTIEHDGRKLRLASHGFARNLPFALADLTDSTRLGVDGALLLQVGTSESYCRWAVCRPIVQVGQAAPAHQEIFGHQRERGRAKTQIWCAVSTYMLIAVIKKELHLDASLNTCLQILSVSVFEKTQISCALRGDDYEVNPLPPSNQLILFGF